MHCPHLPLCLDSAVRFVMGKSAMHTLVAALVVAILTWAASARAQDVAEFYKRNRINLIVSYGPGGGYDIYARVLARHMSRHIPGNPAIVVQNMPGAGSLRGTNYIYNVAPRSEEHTSELQSPCN